MNMYIYGSMNVYIRLGMMNGCMNVCMCMTDWMCAWKGLMCTNISMNVYMYLCVKEWLYAIFYVFMDDLMYACVDVYMVVEMFVCVCINKWSYEMNDWLNEGVSYTWLQRL